MHSFSLTSLFPMLLMATSTPGVCSAQAESYTEPGVSAFDPNQTFRSVGVFGSFGKGAQVQEKPNFGLLTFTLGREAPESPIIWPNYDDGKDIELGRACFPGPATDKKFHFGDWTSSSLSFHGVDDGRICETKIHYSRCFPAVLYETEARHFTWKPESLSIDALAYRSQSGQIRICRPGQAIQSLGSPWLILWGTLKGTDEATPLLVRVTHRPKQVTLGDVLDLRFEGAAGAVVVMPLNGVRRTPASSSDAWASDSLIKEAEFWTRASAAFPVQTDESYRVLEEQGAVEITDRYKYISLRDDWHTEPLTCAPCPPITALAQANGYHVEWGGQKLVRSNLATFLGPYAYAPGDRLTYRIPIPAALANPLTALSFSADEARSRRIQDLTSLIGQKTPAAADYSDGGFNLELKEYSQSFPLLDETTQAKLKPALKASFDTAFNPANLETVTDPETGGRYLMSSKNWCAGEAYDREWYAGRQLDAASEFDSWVDPGRSKTAWPAVQGLYSYFRIYNDWAWSGVLSSLYAYALCGDGMNFAMEGMAGVARMARRNGDGATYRDAVYRTSKEALCTYASWFVTDWVKGVDYVTWTDTSYDYAAKKGRYVVKRMNPTDAETGFGLDIYADSAGARIFRPGSYWHATAAFYWNNPFLYRFYAEHLYDKVANWEFKTMPELHPGWNDKDAIEKFTNQPYGSNLAIVHLDARSVLFGQSADELEALTGKLQSNSAPLYQIRLDQDLVTAGAPQLWLPTGQAKVVEARWDDAARTLTAVLEPILKGKACLDWTWRQASDASRRPGTGPEPKQITVNGARAVPYVIPGGFYRITTSLAPGEKVTLKVVY